MNLGGFMGSCRSRFSVLSRRTAQTVLLLLFSIAYSSPSLADGRCDPANLYGVVWTVDGCSCSGDTISSTKVGAYAEDGIGFSRGWIDARDLTCDAKTGQWKAKADPKYATCSGCKAGYGQSGTCGPATQKLHSSKPTTGLCTCGSPSSVKKVGQAWQWSCGEAAQPSAVDCIAPAQSR